MKWPFRIILLLGMMILLNACFKNLTKFKMVAEKDFNKIEDTAGIAIYNFWGRVDAKDRIDQFRGKNVLGRFNNHRVEMYFDNIPEHNLLRVELHINIHDRWKGNVQTDLWLLLFDGSYQYITTFSNDANAKQAFPSWIGVGPESPAGANAFNTKLPGACATKDSIGGTSTYHIVKTFPHSDIKFNLHCSDAVKPFNDPCTASWSIDYVKITAIKVY